MQRGVARISNFLFGIRFVQIGKTKPNFNKQYIYISNHNSNLDPFISGALIESDYKFIGKAEALKIPVIGYALRHLNVPVERANPEDRARSMADLAHALKQGFSLIIYPEGTRNRGNELVGAFWEGAFRLSIEYGFSIVILAAINSDQRIPPTRWLLNPGKLFYAWSEPIHPAPNEEKEAFSNRCKTIMMDMLRSEINQLKRKK